MTNGEINLEVAVKALEAGLLTSSEKSFIEFIKDYNKYQIRKMSGKQYRFLHDIFNRYKDVV
jgi:hypothetical protein